MQRIAAAEQLKAPKYYDKIARDNLRRLKRVSSRFKSEIPPPCVPAELAAAGWEASNMRGRAALARCINFFPKIYEIPRAVVVRA